ncbi:MAG: TM0106 family RecB-like putative nuclease [Patescibacteria group bacterium]
MSKRSIDEKSFYKYLRCPSWLEREWAEGSKGRQSILELLQDEGLLGSKELELLKGKDVAHVDLEDVDEASLRTLELMKQGAQTIYKGVLVHGHWVGHPDVLERVEGKSQLGNWYYIALDIKRSHRLKDEYMLQGAFYGELLQKLQGVKPRRGYVMHTDGTVEHYELEAMYSQFRLTLDEIEAIFDGKHPEHFLTAGCKQSPYYLLCSEETHSCDDLSRLNRIWRSEVSMMREAGIHTVTDLANAKLDALKNVHGVTMDRLYTLQQQAIALTDKKIITLGEVDLPDEPGVALVLDIESDPLRDVDYLFGVLVVKGDEKTYHSFLARTPEEGPRAWQEFVTFLQDYQGANIYHYGWYEVDVCSRLANLHGAPDSVRLQLSEHMIDILNRLREKVIFPLPFYSLKDIATHLGFRWRTSGASGLDSVLWFHEWLEDHDEGVLQTIVDYNEDDVQATWFLREWAKKNT